MYQRNWFQMRIDDTMVLNTNKKKTVYEGKKDQAKCTLNECIAVVNATKSQCAVRMIANRIKIVECASSRGKKMKTK